MATKKSNQRDASSMLQRTARELREFAKIYNNHKMCPLMHDLLRVLYAESTPAASRRLQRQIARYHEFRKEHPSARLPELILRKKDGTMIGVPPGVLEQLEEYRVTDLKKIQRANGLIVTSAQFGSVLNANVWQALKNYAAHLCYELVVLPIKYGPVQTVYQKELDKRVLTSTFDERLKGHMIFENLELAGGMIELNLLRMRPTLTTFLSDAVCERGGMASQIFAAPKLELAFRPRLHHDYPKACMTTGAVTHPSYNVDNLGQQDRTGEIAEAEHTFSAVILEFSSKKTFHFRQLLSTKEGEFYDIDPIRGGAVFVTPKGVEHRPDGVDTAYLGDWHTGKTHVDVREITFKDMLPILKPKHIVLGDFFDGDSISHWDERQASRRAYKGPRMFDHLRLELNACIEELEWMRGCMPEAQLHVIAANHNEFLLRYLEDLRWRNEAQNLAIGAKLFTMLQEDMEARRLNRHEISPSDPVNLWINVHAPFVKTHGRRSKLILPEDPSSKKILCSLHGDVGPTGGRKTSMKALRKWNQWIIIGHVHSAAILGPVWRVGTSTHLSEHYVDGPATNWTHTHAVIFANGQRQLLNIVNGTFHGQRKMRPRSAGLVPEGQSPKRTRPSRKKAVRKPASKPKASARKKTRTRTSSRKR